jgi:hypothetical protein
MKILKTVFIIWLALFGILIALLLYEKVNKTKALKMFKGLLDDKDDKDK